MKRILAGLILGMVFMTGIVGYGEDALKDWRYEKEIQQSSREGYQAFFLDEEIYKYGKQDLSDIRIINDKNESIPYYIYNEYLEEENEINVQYETKEILSFMKKNDHYMDFQVLTEGDQVDVLGNILVFDIQQERFLKNIQVYGGYDNQKWELVKTDHIYRTDRGEKLDVTLDEGYKYHYYRIVFLNDIENTLVKSLRLVMNKKELTYENYQKTKNANYILESDQQNNSVIVLRNEEHLKIHEIKIISQDDFRRGYDVSYKNSEDKSFHPLMSGEIYQMKLENFNAQKLTIPFSNSFLSAETVQIVIYNKDNKPAHIQGVEISYYVDKVVFEDDGNQGYKVLFGNQNAMRPSYDIEEYKSYIEKEKQGVCSLGSIQKRNVIGDQVGKETMNPRFVFNIIIAITSVFLLFIIMKKSGFKDI